MRDGNLLAQDTPNGILESLNVNSLEDAFIQICMNCEYHAAKAIPENGNTTPELNRLSCVTWESGPPGLSYVENKTEDTQNNSAFRFTSKKRMKALLTKNIITMIRNPGYDLQIFLKIYFLCIKNFSRALLFVFVAPILQLICFYIAIGGNPVGLTLGIISEELNNYEDCFNESLVTTFQHDDTCDFYKLSCRFIHHLNESVAYKVTINPLFCN